MDVRIEPSWKVALASEWDKDYFRELTDFVRARYAQQTVFPPAGKIFAAFDACPFDEVKVVILGQDPYPGYGQANGLSFSVNPGVELPRSLRNIYKELEDDLGCPPPPRATSARGPVRVSCCSTPPSPSTPAPPPRIRTAAGRHLPTLQSAVSPQSANTSSSSWGAYAQRKGEFIDRSRHCVITSPHPSPLSASRGFFGSRPFSRANAYLAANGIAPIDWCGARPTV